MSRGANVTRGPISRLFLAVISSCLRALPQALGAYAFTGGSLFTTLAACSIVRVVVHVCRQFLAPFAVSFFIVLFPFSGPWPVQAPEVL
jgi:predicted membrane protein